MYLCSHGSVMDGEQEARTKAIQLHTKARCFLPYDDNDEYITLAVDSIVLSLLLELKQPSYTTSHRRPSHTTSASTTTTTPTTQLPPTTPSHSCPPPCRFQTTTPAPQLQLLSQLEDAHPPVEQHHQVHTLVPSSQTWSTRCTTHTEAADPPHPPTALPPPPQQPRPLHCPLPH